MEKGHPVVLLLQSESISLASELKANKLELVTVESAADWLNSKKFSPVEMVVIDGTDRSREWIAVAVQDVRRARSQPFLCVYGKEVARDPLIRLAVCENGGAMTSFSAADINSTADRIYSILEISADVAATERFVCPFCKRSGLSEDALCYHCPLYHATAEKLTVSCPVCHQLPKKHILWHIRNCHGPASRGEVVADRFFEDLRVFASSLLVVQRDDKKILLVQETRNRGYWLPGGKVHIREGLCEAAKRETLEEAGIEVELVGVLKFDFIPMETMEGPFCRLRAMFLARPVSDKQDVKTVPDYESLGAAWVSQADLESGLVVRNGKPLMWLKYLAEGKPVYPLSILESP